MTRKKSLPIADVRVTAETIRKVSWEMSVEYLLAFERRVRDHEAEGRPTQEKIRQRDARLERQQKRITELESLAGIRAAANEVAS